MPCPLRLVKPNESRTKLETCPEALELLRSVKATANSGSKLKYAPTLTFSNLLRNLLQNPVAVVAIIGPQRGGKSTIMNLLHGRGMSGFGLGHYMDAQTDGWALFPAAIATTSIEGSTSCCCLTGRRSLQALDVDS
jgi:polynucleotide 5'-kinase involved in rRNA processing